MNKEKNLIIVLFFFAFLIVLLSSKLYTLKTNMLTRYVDKNVTVEKIVYREPKGIISSITMSDLNEHLKNVYRHLSDEQRVIILESIAKTSDKYEISPIVIYGLISVESSFRFWITHKQVIIKGKKDNGIGLGGIVPLWWLDKLRKANIVQTRSDLYDPANNIEAIGFVLAEYKQMPLIKGTTDKTTSALRRYFGGNYKSYSQKIRNVIGSIVFAKIYGQ